MSHQIHVGNMIQARINAQLIKRTTVAMAMGIPNTTIYAYEKRASCSTDNLLRFCHALRYNFFADIARSLPANYAHASSTAYDNESVRSLDQIIAQQAEQIKQLIIENNLLKDLLKK